MVEIYTIKVEKSEIAFFPRPDGIPDFVASSVFDPVSAPKGLSVVCRMGAPDLVHCVIFRHAGKVGGIFALHEQNELLFVAFAETNLAYTLAKGFFGELTANVRYGVDIFESMEGDDD